MLKTSITFVCLVFALSAPCAIAQRGGPPGGGAGVRNLATHGGFRHGAPLGPPNSGRRMLTGFRVHNGGNFFPSAFPGTYPAFSENYRPWDTWNGEYQGPLVIVVAPQPEAPPPPPPPPPPEPARPVIHEYNWPTPDADFPPALFSLVARDGKAWLAIAVWVQDSVVHLIGPDGVAAGVPLDKIDREGTRRLNAEHRLNLWLPPAAEIR